MKKTAVVTAGTGGIGLETALGLAAAGFAVTVIGRDAERGAKAVERINATGPVHPARFLPPTSPRKTRCVRSPVGSRPTTPPRGNR